MSLLVPLLEFNHVEKAGHRPDRIEFGFERSQVGWIGLRVQRRERDLLLDREHFGQVPGAVDQDAADDPDGVRG